VHRRKSSIYTLAGNIFLGGAPRDVFFTPRKVLRNVSARRYIAARGTSRRSDNVFRNS